jgi:hypothetical protein
MSVKINLFHIFIVAPLLLAIDHYRQSKPELWLLLGYNSVIMLFFVGLPISELGWSSWYNLVSLNHLLIWVWFFAWLSWKGYTTPDLDDGYYLLVRWLAFMLIGIHGYLLIGKLNA